jgi:hypothetical protein
MVYNAIRPAAYVLDPSAGPFIGLYHALAFPPEWRQPILDLCQPGRRNLGPYKQVRIRGLNAAIRAVAPDLVSVAERATLDDGKPWLYTDSKYPLSVVGALILSWLHTMQPSAESFPLLQDAYQKLDLKSLHWDLVSVNLAEQTLTDGGTADPAAHLYRLLPEVLAGGIEKLAPYEYCGTQVSFRRVATEQGAELISWPPSEYRPKPKKGQVARPWRFSAVITITLRTMPFSPVPRIHLSTGIRRWVRDSFWIPDGRGVTAYLLADGPWLAGSGESARFAAAKLKWGRREHEPVWAIGGPDGILSRLAASEFPPPKALVQEPETWLHGHDGVIAAVTYHTTMGRHGVGAGLMPSERQRLTRWAAQALLPQLRPVGDMTRSKRKPTTPHHVLQPRKAVPTKDATPEKVATVISANAVIDAANARLRREHLARAVGSDHVFTCHVLYQTDEVRDELINAAERSLDLYAHRAAATSPGTRIWRAPEVEVRLHALPLGALGGPLGRQTVPKPGKEHQAAVAQRRAATQDYLTSLPDSSQVVFVELEGKEAFKVRTTDPKFAIRLGCADAGRVSQFITPERKSDGEKEASPDAAGEGGEDEEEGKLEHRAAATWADGLRQVGMSFVPEHNLEGVIPDRLNQLAFWIVRRNATETTRNKQFTPIAVLVRPGQDYFVGRTPDMQEWVPYPKLLKSLTGQVRGPDLKSAEQQRAGTARFIRQVLYTLRGEPTVVLAHAQNMRSSWEWLGNTQIVPDKIQVGNGPVQALALHGKQLRLIRVCDDERDETPQWWAPDDDELAGLAMGLWHPADAGEADRVFYATTEKPGSHKKKKRDDTKLTPHLDAKSGKPVTNWTRNAWNPTLLEIAVAGCAPGDDPEAWAMYVQQQRFADDYRDALKFPLVLHLAELAHEYALPYDNETQARTEPGIDAHASPASGDDDDPE